MKKTLIQSGQGSKSDDNTDEKEENKGEAT